MAKFFGEMLNQLGLRSGNAFIETDGNKLVQNGAKKFTEDILPKVKDGVLFIDEAHRLAPKKAGEGQSIANEILVQTENNRKSLTVIIAGYQTYIQKELYDYDPGFERRFPTKIVFEDYNEKELTDIFLSHVKSRKWTVDSDKVALVAARRLARRSGYPGFGNAGEVRNYVERAQETANQRMLTKVVLLRHL